MKKGNWFIPALFTLVIGSLLILSIPLNFEKYRLDHLRTFEGMMAESYAFADADGDGIDELIECGGINASGLRNSGCAIRSFQNGKLNAIDQLNVHELTKGEKQVITTDYDKDGQCETILFGMEGSDLYLHVFELPNLNEPILKLRVDSLAREKGEPILRVGNGFERDINGDGFNEVYFQLTVGFPIYPRRSYRLDIKDGKILAGPISSAGFGVIKELSNHPHYLTGNTTSAGNHEDSIYLPFPDLHTYAYVFNEDLEFLFDPIRCGDYPSSSYKAIVGDFLFVLKEQGQNSIMDKRKVETGELLSSKELKGSYKMLICNDKLLLSTYGNLLLMDMELNVIREIENERLNHQGQFVDLNMDGESEYYSKSYLNNTGYIFSSDFDHPVAMEVNGNGGKVVMLTRDAGDSRRELVLHSNNELQFYSYNHNPHYWIRWPYYLLVFTITGLVSTILFWLYRQNIEKRYQQERQLSRLQMLSIKNQVDPHFTLNALNSIDWMYRNNETQKASSFMGKLSRLMNQTVLNSDKIATTLWDELDFCRNYCLLEKLRDERFHFEIEVDEALDAFEIEVPKQLIFTHVENAVKHGLRPKLGEKHLWIKAIKLDSGIQITVEDDGVGYSENSETSGTRKGLKIVEEMLKLWERLRKTKLSVDIKKWGETGTVVKIILTNSA